MRAGIRSRRGLDERNFLRQAPAVLRDRFRQWLERQWSKPNATCPVCGGHVRLYPDRTRSPIAGHWRIERSAAEYQGACRDEDGHPRHSLDEIAAVLSTSE